MKRAAFRQAWTILVFGLLSALIGTAAAQPTYKLDVKSHLKPLAVLTIKDGTLTRTAIADDPGFRLQYHFRKEGKTVATIEARAEATLAIAEKTAGAYTVVLEMFYPAYKGGTAQKGEYRAISNVIAFRVQAGVKPSAPVKIVVAASTAPLVPVSARLKGTAARQPAKADPKPKPSVVRAQAEKFLNLLVMHDYAAAVKEFDETMTRLFPPKKLEAMWKDIDSRGGGFKKTIAYKEMKTSKYHIAFITCQFAKDKLDVKIVLDAKHRVTGLAFVPVTPPVAYKAPDYVDPKSFKEEEVKFGTEKWPLPGTLTVPVGEGPFPGVVLVHGSGPNDRDESLGPNKIFRDLAGGLATRGIAVFRYEKRTREHGAKLIAAKIDPTMATEVIDDALAAARLLRADKRIDPKKIFIVGHSLGATLAPRLGADDPELAGLVALAGATTPIDEHFLRQIELLHEGEFTAEEKKRLENVKRQVARLKDLPPKESVLGMPAAYWLDIRAMMPARVLAKVKQPMFILQGERDYNITMSDFKEWKRLLAGRMNVKLKSYPKLNHYFLAGEGKCTPAEYDKVAHVVPEVIDDIAGWIKAKK